MLNDKNGTIHPIKAVLMIQVGFYTEGVLFLFFVQFYRFINTSLLNIIGYYQ